MTTILEKLEQTFGNHPVYPIKYHDDRGVLKGRVLPHDLIHLLIINREWPVTFFITDEYSAATVQAVLKREHGVSYRMHESKQPDAEGLRAHPTLEMIRKKTIPSIPSFMKRVLNDWCMPPPSNFPDVCDGFIRRHYNNARFFDRLFEAEHGKPFYQVSPEELAQMEFEPLKELYDQARSRASRTTDRKKDSFELANT